MFISGATDDFFPGKCLTLTQFSQIRPFSLLSGGLRTRLRRDRDTSCKQGKAAAVNRVLTQYRYGEEEEEEKEKKNPYKKGVSRNDCKKTVEEEHCHVLMMMVVILWKV